MTDVTYQPTLGRLLEEIRLKAKNGKKMSRLEFSAQLEWTQTRLRNIEQGVREPTDEEFEKLLAVHPKLGVAAFAPQVTEPTPREKTERAEAMREVKRIYGDLVTFDEELEDEDAEGPPQVTGTLETVQLATPVLTSQRHVLDTSDGIRRFSNSEIQTFKRCKRKWWFVWYRKLKMRLEDPTGARAIGNRVHRALAAWYVPGDQTRVDPRDALERAITEDWTRLTTAVAESGIEEIPPELAKRFNEDTALERIMVDGYVQWIEETGADEGLRTIASETYLEADVVVGYNHPMRHELVSAPSKIIAKLDMRVVRESDQARLFVDHKTVGDLTTPVKTLSGDEQMMLYHVIEWLNQLQEGGRAAGALYNMLRKVKRTARANPPFYGRVEVHHNEIELHNFLMSTIAVMSDIYEVTARLNAGENHHTAAYKNWTKDCSWDCDFFAMCPMFDDGSRAEDMVAAYYVEGDPLDYYREKV